MMTRCAHNGNWLLNLCVVEEHPLAVHALQSILVTYVKPSFFTSMPLSVAPGDPPLFVVDVGTLVEPLGEFLRLIRLNYPDGRVIVMDRKFSDDHLAEMLFLGVVGFVTYERAPEELPKAIRSVVEGTAWVDAGMLERLSRCKSLLAKGQKSGMLTTREKVVLGLLERGFCNKEIASSMGISVSTVKFHLKNVYAKIGVHDRLQAAQWAERVALPKAVVECLPEV